MNLKIGRKGKRNKGNGLTVEEEFSVIIVKLYKRPNKILNKKWFLCTVNPRFIWAYNCKIYGENPSKLTN
jgi:hypothetical protein